MPADHISPPLVMLGLIGMAVITGSLVMWGLVVVRAVRGLPIVAYEPRRPIPRRGTDLVMGLLLLAILALIGRQMYASFHSAGDANETTRVLTPVDLVAGFSFELVIVAAAIGCVMAVSGATFRDFGFPTSRLGYDVMLGGAAYLAAVVPVSVIQLLLENLLPYHHPLIESFQHQPGAAMLVVSGVGAIFVAPLCEELIFRVLLQGWFESLEAARHGARQPQPTETSPVAVEPVIAEVIDPIGDNNPYHPSQVIPNAVLLAAEPADVPRPAWWPILLSSALFALMHWGQGLAPIPLFFLAVVLGYVYQRTHRLWPSLVAHALLNAGSLALLWLSFANLSK